MAEPSGTVLAVKAAVAIETDDPSSSSAAASSKQLHCKKISKEEKENPQVQLCRTITSLLLASFSTFPVLASLEMSSNVLAKCLDNFLQLQQWSAAMKYARYSIRNRVDIFLILDSFVVC